MQVFSVFCIVFFFISQGIAFQFNFRALTSASARWNGVENDNLGLYTRQELQDLAKSMGIKANLKTDEIVKAIRGSRAQALVQNVTSQNTATLPQAPQNVNLTVSVEATNQTRNKYPPVEIVEIANIGRDRAALEVLRNQGLSLGDLQEFQEDAKAKIKLRNMRALDRKTKKAAKKFMEMEEKRKPTELEAVVKHNIPINWETFLPATFPEEVKQNIIETYNNVDDFRTKHEILRLCVKRKLSKRDEVKLATKVKYLVDKLGHEEIFRRTNIKVFEKLPSEDEIRKVLYQPYMLWGKRKIDMVYEEEIAKDNKENV